MTFHVQRIIAGFMSFCGGARVLICFILILFCIIYLKRLEEYSFLYQLLSQFRQKNISFKTFGLLQSYTSMVWNAVLKM